MLKGTAWLQSHVSVFVKSRHGKKQSVAHRSGGDASKGAETDKQLCLHCLGKHFGTLAYIFQSCRSVRTSQKVTCLLGKATTFTLSWKRKGQVWKLMPDRMTLPFRWEKSLVKWHKWLPASYSITVNKYIWENCHSGGEFLETRFELIGSACTDGSPVYSNCLCYVNNTLHKASEGRYEWCHPLCMCIWQWIH